jgi:hypothetical protein
MMWCRLGGGGSSAERSNDIVDNTLKPTACIAKRRERSVKSKREAAALTDRGYWAVNSPIGLWRWYINVTITILDIIHRPVFYLKQLNSIGLYEIRLRYEPNRSMLSMGLWRWYINITITILDIIHRPRIYSKHDVSETEFCPPSSGWTYSVGPNR